MFLIRRFLTMVMLLGTFLGGYYLGRAPGSPDILGWAQNRYSQISEAGRFVSEFAQTTKQGSTVQSSEPVETDADQESRLYALWEGLASR